MEADHVGLDVDIGPAGPVVATPLGAMYRTKDDDVVVAPLHRDADGTVAILPTPLAAVAVPTIAPPPAFAGGHLYWVAHGKLVRRAVDAHAGGLEVLADDAVDGSRVAAVVPEGQKRAIAAYVARPAAKDAERTARLWTEGRGVRDLSPEGSGASSVALAAAQRRVVAVVLDGRNAMTPVHARTVEIAEDGEPRIGADVVVTVGPPPEQHTEVVAAETAAGPIALVALAKDERSFGLAAILVGKEPRMDAPIQWAAYPNGLDPAPVASTRACGGTLVAYARPDTADPGAATALAFGTVSADGSIEPRDVVTRERGIRHATMAPVPGGVLLVWATITRAYARVIRC